MKIIEKRRHESHVYYRLYFEFDDCLGSGYSFPCDQDGKLIDAEMSDVARVNYDKCVNQTMTVIRGGEWDRDNNPIPGTGKVFAVAMIPRGVEEYCNSCTHPAIGECNHCGEEVVLHGFTNTCVCGTDYNGSGQELAPRQQWGEETFESVADILMADADVDSSARGW